ncbi:hypothetical protein GHT06_022144 [Daphnia sinensis]|uniref:Potassium channel domain-containing protein n=1 Tax=Daphnia sinensis TaxID=1820382 RepID=A0AAD5L684_9CRUS|nr:hypothetical protein GHT06_022144 [Daphnia sinensis]
MKKQNVRTLSLIVCTFTYLLIGAAIFDALESDNEAKNAQVLREMENMIKERYGIVDRDYRLMEVMVLKGAPHYAGKQWKFAGAFYYATTVLTTIGYGHSTPHTIGGKLFTMAYALVGIPLGLVMFQSIGERLNNFSSFVIRNVKRVLKYDSIEASETNLILVVTAITTITISGGAAAFSKYEGWTYFDSIYYCFVTLTTIGFGDMVALQQDNALTDKPEYVAFVLIFILFGLAIVAACLNLLVLRLVTLNTEDERRDEAAAVKAAQGAVRLEGDVITANGSILSGQIPREHGGVGLAGSLIDLEDSKSVCSCSCQVAHNHCFPCLSLVARGKRNKGRKGRKSGGTVCADYSCGPSPASMVGRSYGALSNTGTYSAASLGICDDTIFLERYTPASGVGDGIDPETGHQGEYYELQNAESLVSARLRSGVIYASSTRSSITATSPSRLYPTLRSTASGVESPTPDRVLTRRRRTGGPTINLSLRGLIRRLRHFRRRVMSTLQHGRPTARQRVSQARSRKSSLAAAKQRSCVVQSPANLLASVSSAGPPPINIGGPAPSTDDSIDCFVDVPLNDNTFLTWSSSVLAEKRASY